MLALQQSSRTRQRARGVTLVEMMVAITITLIMIAALTQAFQSISESVSDSRAMITLTEATRKTSMTLQRDLDGLTVPARPWPEVGSGLGYLEIVEGRGSDLNPQPTALLDPTDPDYEEKQSYLNLLGDFDDLIMFTSRSGDDPFIGRIQQKYLRRLPNNTTAAMQVHEAFDSPLAEVLWWTNFESFNDLNDDGLQGTGEEDIDDPADNFDAQGVLDLADNETIVLRRRNLLLRPDLNNSNGDLGILVKRASGGGAMDARLIISQFMANNDLSVQIKPRANGDYYLAANSLADLTRRENRAGHWTFDPSGEYIPAAGSNAFMSRFILNRDAPPFLLRMGTNTQTASIYTTTYSGSPLVASSSITGDATMLTNVLAFDVRVYDPLAPILSVDGVAMAPTTKYSTSGNNRETYPPLNNTYPPGHQNYVVNSPVWQDSSTTPRTIDYLGNGEFVDLNYANGNTLPDGSDYSLFAGGHANPNPLLEAVTWKLPTDVGGGSTIRYEAYTYDTWSWDYERDGLNQDRDSATDEATNGVDDDPTANGVDDVGERETTPPYPHPLRGVQISIRVHDQSTRQIRQFSVVSDFTPE